MSKRFWAVGALLAIVAANAGCVSCCHESYAKAWHAAPDCELPPDCRGRVHVFMVHGVTPTHDCGLAALRRRLAESGFAQVGEGELLSAPCIAIEIKRIHQCDPGAKFVLIGYDFGGAAAAWLARDLTEKRIPVEAVVLLNPLGCGEPCGVRTLLVTSGCTTSTAPFTERVVVATASHARLPGHPTTVAVVTKLLKEIATTGYQPEEGGVWMWSYPHAPEMRPIAVGGGDEWDFLAEQGGTPYPIGTRVTTTPLQQAPSTASAKPVAPK